MRTKYIAGFKFLFPYLLVIFLYFYAQATQAQILKNINKGALERKAGLAYCDFIREKLSESSGLTVSLYVLEHRRELEEDKQAYAPAALRQRAQAFDYPSLLKKIKAKEPAGCDVSPYRNLLRFGGKFKSRYFEWIVDVVKEDLQEYKRTESPEEKKMIKEEALQYCEYVLAIIPQDSDAQALKQFVEQET